MEMIFMNKRIFTAFLIITAALINPVLAGLENLEPADFWNEFSNVTSIYRPSKGEQKIREYISSKAERLGFSHFTDEAGNLLIRIPATEESKNLPGIIIQGHLDMVCVTRPGCEFCWGKDKIKPIIENGWLKAESTTLGADNGAGIAAMLKLMQSLPDQHGPMELLFTADEEVDFSGVCGIKPGFLQGKILLNIDSEESGEFNIGCAGGQADTIELSAEKVDLNGNPATVKITLSGGLSGHSGVDIHRSRANAIMELFRFTQKLQNHAEFYLAECNGGVTDTAIPGEASIVICFEKPEFRQVIVEELKERQRLLKLKYNKTDPNLILSAAFIESPQKAYSKEDTREFIDFICSISCGILSMSHRWPGNVQTSMNPGLLTDNGSTVKLVTHLQSSSLEVIKSLSSRLLRLTEQSKLKHSAGIPYRPWEPDTDNTLVDAAVKIHERLTGKNPVLKVVHAGVECGELQNIYPEMKMLSFGPDIKHAHTPDEALRIGAVRDFLNLLNELVIKLPEAVKN